MKINKNLNYQQFRAISGKYDFYHNVKRVLSLLLHHYNSNFGIVK